MDRHELMKKAIAEVCEYMQCCKDNYGTFADEHGKVQFTADDMVNMFMTAYEAGWGDGYELAEIRALERR